MRFHLLLAVETPDDPSPSPALQEATRLYAERDVLAFVRALWKGAYVEAVVIDSEEERAERRVN